MSSTPVSGRLANAPGIARGTGAVGGRRTRAPSPAATRNWGSGAFHVILGMYVAVSITKIHDSLPFVSRLQPAKVVAALLLPAALVALRWVDVRAALRARPTVWIGVTAVLALLSVPGAVWPGYAVQFWMAEYWKTLLVFVIMVAAWIDRRAMNVTLIAAVVGALPPAIRMVIAGSEGERAHFGLAFDPNESALMFLTIIPIALHLARRKSPVRWLYYGAALIMVGGIVRTGSRGGFLGIMVLGLMAIVNAPPRLRIRQLLVTALGVAAFAATANEATWGRLKSIASPTEDYNYSTEEGRVEIWKRGMKYMVTHPFLGVGVNNFPIAEGMISGKVNSGFGIKYSAAHNSFVQIGAELGVFGLLAFTLMIWSCASGCRYVIKSAAAAARTKTTTPAIQEDELLATMALLSLICFLVAGSFLSFAYHPITYFVVGLCAALRLRYPVNGVVVRLAPVRRGVRANRPA